MGGPMKLNTKAEAIELIRANIAKFGHHNYLISGGVTISEVGPFFVP